MSALSRSISRHQASFYAFFGQFARAENKMIDAALDELKQSVSHYVQKSQDFEPTTKARQATPADTFRHSSDGDDYRDSDRQDYNYAAQHRIDIKDELFSDLFSYPGKISDQGQTRIQTEFQKIADDIRQTQPDLKLKFAMKSNSGKHMQLADQTAPCRFLLRLVSALKFLNKTRTNARL